MKRVTAVASSDDLPAADAASDTLADPSFSADLIAWQKTHGRHSLPWQHTRDAYRIWLSEVMLQQTQVVAVIPYYLKFLERFPDIGSLAEAPSEAVMAHWSGLGYYSRARNLHRCAQQVVAQYAGVFPADPVLLAELPGIGRSTAAAIAAFSYGTRAAILDGNVKRVFARVFGIDRYPGEKTTEAQLWRRAVALLPVSQLPAYTQGLMDLGATLCTRSKPACTRCPLAARCVALASDRVADLPVRKPKKAVPQKHAIMLVVTHQHQVLLIQRPEQGIWGGLLSLPELDGFVEGMPVQQQTPVGRQSQEDAIAGWLAPYGEVSRYERLHPFLHGFTHFKLHVVPYQVWLSRRLPVTGAPGQVWVDYARLAHAPLPAPVKKLLLALCCTQDLFAG